MNITPLIDVVFLLIIFFMLVNNITSQESVKLIVPHVTDPVTHQMRDKNRIVVNLTTQSGQASARRKDPLAIPGRPGRIKVGLVWFSHNNLAGVTAALERARKKNPKIHVLLRADAALQYRAVRPVIAAIASAGIGKVDIVAYSKKRGG